MEVKTKFGVKITFPLYIYYRNMHLISLSSEGTVEDLYTDTEDIITKMVSSVML